MAKGKKFNAAEKYFMEKEIVYRKMVNQREEEIKELKTKLEELNLLNIKLQKENDMLNKENSKLLEYTGLSKVDAKKVCKKDIEMANLISGLNALRNAF